MNAIPPIMHQTWKNTHIPAEWQRYQASWWQQHPQWTYRLWTDDDNRRFIHTHYAWFLPTYDAYPEAIMRVDAVRYFLLHHYGGVYVDLDFECIQPLASLLSHAALVLGVEPPEHTDMTLARERALDRIVCNALMASQPQHPFWEHVFTLLMQCRNEPGPLDATGPFFLTRAYESYAEKQQVRLLPSTLIYPVTKTECWAGKLESPGFRQQATQHAYALHHWSGSWYTQASAASSQTAGAPIYRLHQGRIVESSHLDEGRAKIVPEQAPQEPPRISCLMVTRGRYELARQALQDFRQQTYPNRELLIMDDDEDERLAHDVEMGPTAGLVYLRLPPENLTLGALRNLAVAYASGTYICQWDDDDRYHPRRLERQMATLQALHTDACFVARPLLWWPQQQRLAVSRPRIWECSMVCSKAKLIPYPHARKGEDTPVVAHLLGHCEVALLDDPLLYTYIVHGRNTWEATHFERHWQLATAQYTGKEYERLVRELGLTHPFGTQATHHSPPSPTAWE